jgi:hypothetical protein
MISDCDAPKSCNTCSSSSSCSSTVMELESAAMAAVPASLQHVLIYRLPGCSTADTALQLRLTCKELRHAVDQNITRCGKCGCGNSEAVAALFVLNHVCQYVDCKDGLAAAAFVHGLLCISEKWMGSNNAKHSLPRCGSSHYAAARRGHCSNVGCWMSWQPHAPSIMLSACT